MKSSSIHWQTIFLILAVSAALSVTTTVHANSITVDPANQTTTVGQRIQITAWTDFQSLKAVFDWGDGITSTVNALQYSTFVGQHLYVLPMFYQQMTFQATVAACDPQGLNCASTPFTVTVVVASSGGSGSGGGAWHI